jgi:hypothetical protein
MSKKKKNINVTFGYKAVITVQVKADNEDEAKQIAQKEFNDKFRLPGANNIVIEDDSFQVSGVINMDETWNML